MQAVARSESVTVSEVSPFVTVMVWNILAHEFTNYEAPNHLCGDDQPEAAEQRLARESLVLERIRATDAHIVLLQEVSANALDTLGDRFRVHLTLGANFSPGTAVLVRSDLTVEHVDSVPGSKATGGQSKSATVVTVQANGTCTCLFPGVALLQQCVSFFSSGCVTPCRSLESVR
jgi:hypothetical protein